MASLRPGTQESDRRSVFDYDDSENDYYPDTPVKKPQQGTNAKKGCISSCIGVLWSTKDMKKKEEMLDREVYVRITLRELIVYIIFLVILCILTFGMNSPTMFYFTSVLKDMFVNEVFDTQMTTFATSTQIGDFWNFLRKTFLGSAYWDLWYDNQTVLKIDDRNIFYENRMLGIPRIRQLRVTNSSCPIPADFQRAIIQCFSVYSLSVEDQAYFGNGLNGTQWRYSTQQELGGTSYWGLLTTYGGGGNYVDLSANKSVAEETIRELFTNLWVTRGTRVVFVDFTVYNANVNLFCIVKFVFEFPATGGIIPSYSFRTVKLLRYVTRWDYFVLSCELIFVMFNLYYIVEELLELYAMKWKYFSDSWNYLDIVVTCLSLYCIALNAYCSSVITNKLSVILQNPDKYANFEMLGYWQLQFNCAVAVTVFFSWFKLFKYISFNKTMTQLSATLSRCSKDVAGFAIMFFIVFFAFAQLGYLLFGTQVKDYSSFTKAVFALLRTILGDFDFYVLQNANRVLGPIFFLTYVFFVFFVLLNMFLAIINDTYSEVKAELANQRNEFELGDYFKRGYNNMMEKLGRRSRLLDIENALRLTSSNKNGLVTFGDVRASLRKHNFSDLEIEMFFAKFDVDGSRLLEPDEVVKMLTDLESNLTEIGGAELHVSDQPETERPSSASLRPAAVQAGEFNTMQRRVDRLEGSIGSIANKIDAVLVKLDTMQRSGSTRKQTMGKMLDMITQDDDMDEATKRRQMEKLIRDELEHQDD